MCQVPGKTCESIMANYTDMVIRFTDSNGFIVPPKSYLKTDVTDAGNTVCYNMIIGNFINPD
jgi:hypothetical protein